jgi:excisionase family DNA binding protein
MEKTILTFSEALEFTGLSRAQLYRLTSRKEIPHSKPGGKLIYFLKKDLESYMMSKYDSYGKDL